MTLFYQTGKTNGCVARMMKELPGLKGVKSVIQLLKILDTLANSAECRPIAHAGYVNLNKETKTTRMNLVYAHVMKNFKQKISLEEVAAIALVHEAKAVSRSMAYAPC